MVNMTTPLDTTRKWKRKALAKPRVDFFPPPPRRRSSSSPLRPPKTPFWSNDNRDSSPSKSSSRRGEEEDAPRNCWRDMTRRCDVEMCKRVFVCSFQSTTTTTTTTLLEERNNKKRKRVVFFFFLFSNSFARCCVSLQRGVLQKSRRARFKRRRENEHIAKMQSKRKDPAPLSLGYEKCEKCGLLTYLYYVKEEGIK